MLWEFSTLIPPKNITEDRDGTGHLTKHEFILSMQGFLIFCWAKKNNWQGCFLDDMSHIYIYVYINIYKLFGNFCWTPLKSGFFAFGFQWIFSETFPSLTFPLKPLESWKGRASPIGGAQRQKQTSKSQMAIRPAGSHLRWLFWCFFVWNLHGLAFV